MKLSSVTWLHVNDTEIWTRGTNNMMKLYNLRGELMKSIQTNSGSTSLEKEKKHRYMCVRQWTSCSLDVQLGLKTPVYLHWSSFYYQLIILSNWHHNRQLKSDIVCTNSNNRILCVFTRYLYTWLWKCIARWVKFESLSRLQRIQNKAVSNTIV